jgi:type II secretory ATPase GspE/PulE/Tfp pilus assembly ATPase PilB-like protein
VRQICQHCKRPAQDLGANAVKYLKEHGVSPEQACQGAGCEHCRQTGYSGRIGIYEMFSMDDDARDMITGNPTLMELRRHCRQQGMVTLRKDGFAKVAAGITTVDEILRVTEGI